MGHKIEAKEPIWVHTTLVLTEDGDRVELDDSQTELGDTVAGYAEDSEYSCVCGEEFNNFSKAKKHLKEEQEE